jgi:hypothetical protein
MHTYAYVGNTLFMADTPIQEILKEERLGDTLMYFKIYESPVKTKIPLLALKNRTSFTEVYP